MFSEKRTPEHIYFRFPSQNGPVSRSPLEHHDTYRGSVNVYAPRYILHTAKHLPLLSTSGQYKFDTVVGNPPRS